MKKEMINVLNTEGQGYYDKHYLEESKKYIGVSEIFIPGKSYD